MFVTFVSNAFVIMTKRRRVFLIGIGDLGSRLSQLIAERQLATELRLVGRGPLLQAWADILSVATGCKVTFARMDALDQDALKRELTSFEPHLILQCASLLSPWAFSRSMAPAAQAIVSGGFALQVSAQLPIITTVMEVHRALRLDCSVVNCSFPDLTHPMLRGADLAPTVGIGNVAMIAARIRHSVRSSANAPVRVIAHHSQVSRFMAEGPDDGSLLRPIVYRGDKRIDCLGLFGRDFPRLHSGTLLNYLSASTAMSLLSGLLHKRSQVRTHAPGVSGLPGGYPILVSGGRVSLDLPSELSAGKAIAFNIEAARLDGIERISLEGTLTYTPELRHRIKPWCPELCEPLSLEHSLKRWNILKAIYDETC